MSRDYDEWARERDHHDRYDYEYHPPLPPPDDGLKLRNHRRPVGHSVLALALEDNLERNFDEKRRRDGAALAREGRLHDIFIGEDGVVSARAVGSRHYRVSLRFKVLPSKLRRNFPKLILSEPEIISSLSRGQVPLEKLEDLMRSILPNAEDLIPDSAAGTCTCPYGANCKHQAALAYLLVEAIDTDQTLLLSLRGIPREELLDVIGSPSPVMRKSVVVSLAEFWAPAAGPSKIITPRPEPNELLARLGDVPEGISQDEAAAVQEMLRVILSAADAFA